VRGAIVDHHISRMVNGSGIKLLEMRKRKEYFDTILSFLSKRISFEI
jgi:hypothetical protein